MNVRNAVSDECLLRLGMFTGNLKKGNYYVRAEGRLVRITVADKYPFERKDMGLQDSPENIAAYYRNLNDASLKERLKMVAGKVISLTEYISSMANNGQWNWHEFMKKYEAMKN